MSILDSSEPLALFAVFLAEEAGVVFGTDPLERVFAADSSLFEVLAAFFAADGNGVLVTVVGRAIVIRHFTFLGRQRLDECTVDDARFDMVGGGHYLHFREYELVRTRAVFFPRMSLHTVILGAGRRGDCPAEK